MGKINKLEERSIKLTMSGTAINFNTNDMTDKKKFEPLKTRSLAIE